MSNERYGRSFVQELLDDGREDEALEAAERTVAERPQHAAAHYDHACVLEALERRSEALEAYEAALTHNQRERTVESFMLDDAYFSALVDEASSLPAQTGVALMARYRTHAPMGSHLAEVSEWQARLSGQAPSLLDKTKG